MDKRYFKRKFSTYSNNQISISWNLYKKVINKLRLSGKISSNYKCGNSFPLDTSKLRSFGIDVVLFYMSIGSFHVILKYMLKEHLDDFVEKFVKSNANNFDEHAFFKFATNIRFIRNRLAHTNQCLSVYLENELSKITNLSIDENCYNFLSGELSKTILFMLKNISTNRKRIYVIKYFWFIIKYRNLIERYHNLINLEPKLLSKILKLSLKC